MLYRYVTEPMQRPPCQIGGLERSAIVSLLSLVSVVLILGWLASRPAIGLPSDFSDGFLEASQVPTPSKTAADLGEPIFPDYYSLPFGGWRSGSDQSFSLIPVEPNGRYEVFMELPAPRQEPESRKQEARSE
jgi:hypothetical protein